MSNPSETSTQLTPSEQEKLEAERLIGWDFVFSIVVLIFSIFVIANSLTMPFSGNVGGVTTVWYESPGLLPLFIGCCLFLAGITVFLKSAREGGRKLFQQHFADVNPTGFLLSGGGILSYIFVFITWFDFFLGSFVFLLFYISLYYLEDDKLSRKLIAVYYGIILLCLTVFFSGLDKVINAQYDYATDFILVAAALLLIFLLAHHASQSNGDAGRKVRIVILVALLFPSILVPAFRYFLLVPMPKEGLIVEQVFNHTYYTYLAPVKEVEDGNLSADQLDALENAF